MNYSRRTNAAHDSRVKNLGNRRRSSVRDVALATGRRCSLSTFTSTSRIRSNSKGYLGRDYSDSDVEQCRPNVEDLPTIPGYDDVTFEPRTVPPPNCSSEQTASEDGATMEPLKQESPPTEKEIREILLQHAASKCSYDKRPAIEMKILNINHCPGYKYTLESFTESRQVAWSFEPYTGETLDEPASGYAPDPWLLPCSNGPTPFQSHAVIIDVPHSDALRACPGCGGVGSRRCNVCSAAGWERCSFCLGDGHKMSLQGHRERCFLCLGTGRKKCSKCCGDTIAACRGCSGTGQIRCFLAVTITWSNHVDSHVIESPEATAIGKKLELASGNVVFQAENVSVSPISAFPDESLNTASTTLIEKHRADLGSEEKFIMQRHCVRTIPVHCVTYEWKQQVSRFYIYGTQGEVFAPDYPQSISCCNLL